MAPQDKGKGGGGGGGKKGKWRGGIGTFENMNLLPDILRAVKRKGYRLPTPIQRKAIPLAKAGHDVVAMSRTGSGKTAAFMLPVLNRLKEHDTSGAGPRALILSPTRELTMQTFKFAEDFGKYTDLRAALLIGGDSMQEQFAQLADNPDVLIATPGRLIHHMDEIDGFNLKSVRMVVIDEADRMFELGFSDQVKRIFRSLHESKQCLLFSATMPAMVAEFASAGLKDPQLVRLDSESRISDDLEMRFFTVSSGEKLGALLFLVKEVISSEESTIVFVSTKHHVELITKIFRDSGLKANGIHGSMDQTARTININAFRNGSVNLLVVTDVAARGVDIPLINNVVNYDFPARPKLFVHRVGRAARAGRTGCAFSLVTHDGELPYVMDLHMFLARKLQPCTKDVGDEELSSKEVTYFGRFPQSVLDSAFEYLKLKLEDADVQNMMQTANRGYKQYLKSRQGASAESCGRVKAMDKESVHPFLFNFISGDGKAEASLIEYQNMLKTFRPNRTILEGDTQRSQAAANGGDFMTVKRRHHDKYIEKTKTKNQEPEPSEDKEEAEEEDGGKEKAASKRARKKMSLLDELDMDTAGEGTSYNFHSDFRDSSHFVSSQPPNKHADVGCSNGNKFAGTSFADIVMDMTGEDESEMNKNRKVHYWDAKQKKYVHLREGEEKNKRKRVFKNESGKRVEVSKGDLYNKWRKTSKTSISEGVDSDGRANQSSYTSLASKRKFGLRHAKEVANSNARSELRSAGEIRKMRKKKEQYRDHLKRKGSSSGPPRGHNKSKKSVTSSIKLSNKRKAKGGGRDK
ncbi:DEAD-box ATP-dependent RNA helicase [Chloropicon primus]|nr:DEAD-box ATP-dependent RNA helicase [Chloropicon primus]